MRRCERGDSQLASRCAHLQTALCVQFNLTFNCEVLRGRTAGGAQTTFSVACARLTTILIL